MSAQPTPNAGHEGSGVRTRPIAGFAIGLAALILIALGTLHWLFGAFEQRARAADVARHTLAPEKELPPEPRLLADPRAAYAEYRRAQAARLSTYGWVDRPSGVVHIPIERAIELVAAEGLPTR